MKRKTGFKFDRKKELESFKGALNDPGMKAVEKKLSSGEFSGRLIRDHSRRVGKGMKEGKSFRGAVKVPTVK